MSVVSTESRDTIEREGAVLVPDKGKGEMNGKGWRNLAISLIAVVSMLVGAFAGDFAASVRYSGLHGRMTTHEQKTGHPVMIQRVSTVERDLADLKEMANDNHDLLNKIAGKVGVVE